MINGYRIVDLSVPIEPSPSELKPPSVEHQDHSQSIQLMSGIFGVPPEDLPGGLGWAIDDVTLITHAGTHLDAPWHYAPTAGGERARTIDEVPLEWCFSDGLVLDMRHKGDGERIEVDDIEIRLDDMGYEIKPYDIVLILTGVDRYWGTAEYIEHGPGMIRDSTLWLIERGVKVMGIDAWGFDRPFKHIAEEYGKTGDASIIWEAHYAGIEAEYCHIEKLANLHMLPPYGFKVACFPISITGASAGWTRAVAIIEEQS